MHGAEDEATERGYTVLLGRSDDVRPGGEVIARLIGEGRVDGMALQVGDAVQPAGLRDLITTQAPIVLVNSSYPGHVGSVTLDDHRGALIATQHLLELGHERIAFANGLPRSFTAKRRRTGYKLALATAGLRMPKEYETRIGYTVDNGRTALHRLMALDPKPTGIVVANVNAAVGLLGEARKAGIRVPEDLSVVTVHDSWTAENTWPPLTAVKMQFYTVGRAAVRSVIRRIETGETSDEVVTDPPPELVIRESTAPPRNA
jgi:LacI family transcriptional regulator